LIIAEFCPSLAEGMFPVEVNFDHFLFSRLKDQKSFSFFPEPEPPKHISSFLTFS
jgi:hypothetical protein